MSGYWAIFNVNFAQYLRNLACYFLFLFYVHIFLAIAPKLHIIRIWKNSSIPEHYKKHWQNTKEGDTCLFHAVVA